MNNQTSPARFESGRMRTLVVRVLVLGLLWWILTEGSSPLTWLGLIGIFLAVALSMHLTPDAAWSLNIGALVRFVPYFMWQSLLGGLDVARRALSPRASTVRPVIIGHRFTLTQESARVFFLWVVSLLPGTAGVDLHGDEATVHVLDESLADRNKLRELEERVAKLFDDGQ